ncbi:hypothetical protein PV328_002028 [Microctonus aethiopoides]|uniref:Uncharacterized protein n=1 Tax=Microctonus aethiopoides TaxID=144406 RepID=A0AA39KXY6_9HYME|nr:hypothetical protein PV328_002028 [Microctonus aethiopoides]
MRHLLTLKLRAALFTGSFFRHFEQYFHGAIFEQGTDEVQSAFKYAIAIHNQNNTTRRFDLQAYVDVINTADAFKLSRLSQRQSATRVKRQMGSGWDWMSCKVKCIVKDT